MRYFINENILKNSALKGSNGWRNEYLARDLMTRKNSTKSQVLRMARGPMGEVLPKSLRVLRMSPHLSINLPPHFHSFFKLIFIGV